jgi:hypothetical protein
VLHWDSTHPHVVIKAVKVDAREGTFHVHTQNGRHLPFAPGVLDHLHDLVEGVCRGSPGTSPELVLREYPCPNTENFTQLESPLVKFSVGLSEYSFHAHGLDSTEKFVLIPLLNEAKAKYSRGVIFYAENPEEPPKFLRNRPHRDRTSNPIPHFRCCAGSDLPVFFDDSVRIVIGKFAFFQAKSVRIRIEPHKAYATCLCGVIPSQRIL